MAKIRVLIADDDEFPRNMILRRLGRDPEFEIVGVAQDGAQAVKIAETKEPDLVLMDLQMPVMDGLEALKAIMARRPVPVVIVTSYADTQNVYKCLSHGSIEVMAKSEFAKMSLPDLFTRLKILSRARVSLVSRPPAAVKLQKPVSLAEPDDAVVAIASSTGGPKALSVIFSALPEHFKFPVLVAQHIDQSFTKDLVDWLKTFTPLAVKTAENGETPKPGNVYFAAPNHHLVIDGSRAIRNREAGTQDIYVPSCNALLNSVADAYGRKSIGVILTGMAADGVEGLGRVKKSGGITVAQDEKTSIIFGMPGEAIKQGHADYVLPLEHIGPFLAGLGARK